MSTTQSNAAQPCNDGVLERITAEPVEQRQPVLFTGATVRTLDPRIGDMTGADVLIGGRIVVGVGPGIITAAGDDGATVVDCTGMTIVPAVIDAAALAGGRRGSPGPVGTLTPGNPADLAVLPDRFATSTAHALDTVLNHPDRVCVLLAGGEVLRWDGTDTAPATADQPVPARGLLSGHPYLGTWIDTTGFLEQTLTADGRYDETRGGRPHAFQGQYRIDGQRVDYLDDLGFWAYGEFIGDHLHHAGYVMTRA